ncbi:MAG: LptF/LptG family permease [Bacteroidales bacterium]|nr:LptF/LptG family permease [Bacteroidales bacterium]
MKKLHKLVITSYIGPFVVTFFISLFILLMQFLWKYIDDLVGKGLEWYIIAELLFYFTATFVPLALPLAVLLSSIMTMGRMGEHYELVAFKSAGISLRKIMWPMVMISMFLVLAAFYFSNNVLPVANLKGLSLLYDVRQQRPAFNIQEGFYYHGIDNFVIRVDEKDDGGQTLRGIKIYDHSDRRGNINLSLAEWGTMAVTPDKRFLVLTLYNGVNYQEAGTAGPLDPSRPFQRTKFEQQTRKFDLSMFDLRRTDEDLFRGNFRMLNISQLIHFEDSLSTVLNNRKNTFIQTYKRRMPNFPGSDKNIKDSIDPALFRYADIHYIKESPVNMQMVINNAMDLIRTNRDHTNFSHEDFRQRQRTLARYQIEFHRKFTLSFACVVLFLIGAPLGAIIRKGGFGLPLVISVLLFVVFHVMSMMGEKFVREGVLQAHLGMWLAPAALLPVGILLTIKATTDSSLLNTDSYLMKLEKMFSFLIKGKNNQAS